VATLPLVLAIEPDLRQAAIVKRIVRENVLAEIAVVDSRDAAIEAIKTAMPDVVLLSALLSPRDEDDLVAHLRTLEGAAHLQTHTIPQLASSLGPRESGRGGLLSAFRRKKEPEHSPSGCDPDLYAEEIRLFLQQAAAKKKEAAETKIASPFEPIGKQASPRPAAAPAQADAAAQAPAESSWSSPFEWRPSGGGSSQYAAPPPAAASKPGSSDPGSLIPDRESFIGDPVSPDPVRETLIVGPGSGLPAGESLIQGYAGEREASLPDEQAEPVIAPEPVVAPEPIVAAEPPAIPEPKPVFVAPEPEPEPLAAPLAATPYSPTHDSPIEDPRTEDPAIEDSGSGTEDEGLGIRDPRLGPLASWARSENGAHAFVEPTGELRSMLAGLAVPLSVGSVSYGCGCRIRRVRVRPLGDAEAPQVDGAVILSKRTLAELRSQP
jgi:hypothetical protein